MVAALLLYAASAVTINDWARIQLRDITFGKYVRTQPGGHLVADQTNAWLHGATFEAHVLPNNQWQLRSIKNRQWVSATNGGGSDASASRADPSGWETWNVKSINDHQVQLQVATGNYWLGVDGSNGVVVRASSPSAWETFNVTVIPQLKGVNLGGWLLHEDWIAPQEFTGYTNFSAPTCPNSCGFAPFDAICANLNRKLGADGAKQRLESFRNEFINEGDFQWLKENGFNTVRVPIGFWDLHPTPPYISGGLAYLDRTFDWAASRGIRVIIDFHGAPGSQTQCDSVSGTCHSVSWTSSSNQQLSLEAIEALAARYAKRSNLLGIELLNEPNSDDGHLPRDALYGYYQKAYGIIRKYSATTLVIFMEWNWKVDWWNGKLSEPQYTNVMVDLHQYWCWSSGSAEQTINDAKGFWSTVDHISTLYPAFVGEWSLCGPGINSNQQKQDFANAQTGSFSHGMGWTFWTLKKGKGGTGDTAWSLRDIYAAGIRL